MISILKITKGNNSLQKIQSFNTKHIQNTFICTQIRAIISSDIEVIERTRFLCRKLKRRIIQQKMQVERPFSTSAKWLVMLYICTKFREIILNGIKVIERIRFLYGKLQRGIITQKCRTDAASVTLVQERRRKKPWVTKDVLDLCDERRDLKKKRYEAEGAKEYREANRRIQKAV